MISLFSEVRGSTVEIWGLQKSIRSPWYRSPGKQLMGKLAKHSGPELLNPSVLLAAMVVAQL